MVEFRNLIEGWKDRYQTVSKPRSAAMQRFVRTTWNPPGEHNPQAALAADLGEGNTSYLDKGRVIVRLANGHTMEWKHAIRGFGPKK